MMKRVIGYVVLAVIATSVLFGCTASEILKGYVDQPLVEVILDHGPPVASFDMGDGTRAFIWTKTNTIYIPGSATSNTTANIYGGLGSSTLYGTTTTTYTPPKTGSYSCQYAVFAKRTNDTVEGPAAWTVVDYRKPTFMCE